jgi:hypothetical protein
MSEAAMQREPSVLRSSPFLPPLRRWFVPTALAAVGAFAAGEAAVAQAQHPPRAAAATPAPAREEGVRWQSLTPAQRDALAPLEREWPTIDAQRKQKWLALAARMKTVPAEERERIHARMVDWAKLTPAERGQARLRFEEARQVPATDRSARWRAYQALPPEERAQLAARAASDASRAREPSARAPRALGRESKEAKSNLVPNPALSQTPRTVAPTLVQAAPGATTTSITRRPAPPAHQQSGMPKIATTPEFVQRSTLLPRRGPQAAAITPASAAAPGRTPGPAATNPASSPAR